MAKRRRRNRKKEIRLKIMLTIIWVLFLTILIGGGIFIFKNKEDLGKDLGLSSRFAYETNSNMEINALVRDYYTALAACDQDTLKASVTNPSDFDDMTIYESKSKVITGYSNINCYTLEGVNEGDILCYAVFNISINGVESKPLDIATLYITKDGTKYLINNNNYSDEVKGFIKAADESKDIQELFSIVKEDNEKCLAEDETFKEFYDTISN